MTEQRDKRKLHLVWDADCQTVAVGPYEITVAPPTRPPFAVDATVEEQDTWLILGESPEIIEPTESFDSMVSQMEDYQPLKPGTVIIRHGRPLKLLAVVHDIDRRPNWNEAWVSRALDGIFREAGPRHLESLALPLLGMRHGSMETGHFIELLLGTLKKLRPGFPKRLWLIVPVDDCSEVLSLLHWN